jgi:hypothetical protein
MLSAPPAIRKSASPLRIACAAMPSALRPELQSRLTVTPGTASPMPASSTAMRATLRLSSPAWLAQPRITSSRADQSARSLRAISALSGSAARSSARMVASDPLSLPIGVRTASQMKACAICLSFPGKR